MATSNEGSTVTRIDEGLLSISLMHREFGMDRRTIARLLDENDVKPYGDRNGSPVYRLRDVLPALTGDGAKVRPADELALAKAAESRIDAEAKSDKLKKSRGLLLEREPTRREFAKLAMACIQTMQTLPDILERDCGLPPEAVVRALEVVDRERTKLADMLTQADDEIPTIGEGDED